MNMKKQLIAIILSMAPTAAMAQSTPSWKSYMQTRNPADIVSSAGTSDSVAAWLGKKMDVSNGTANSPTLNGGNETKTPTDLPGTSGTAIPNTLWVDENYEPRNTFISADTTWTVCASNCNYTNPLDAWNAAVNANFINGAILTISITDGTYNINNSLTTNVTKTQYVKIIGDTASPANVVLNFTNTKGTNSGGVYAPDGGKIGLIDGVTITTPSDGTGAIHETYPSGGRDWNSQSYGGGVTSSGNGSIISLGSHVAISNFYYSMLADNNGGIDASNGGVSMSDAGMANAMARGGGVIVCTPCTATDVRDSTLNTGSSSTNNYGVNYYASRGGSLYIDKSTAQSARVAGIYVTSGGSIWARQTTVGGGLGGSISSYIAAVRISGNSSADITGSNISGFITGVYGENGGYVLVDSCNIHNNTYGVIADGGRVTGSSVTITNNAVYGIQAIHQGSVVMTSTYSNMSNNNTNFNVQAAGTESASGSAYTASSIDVQ